MTRHRRDVGFTLVELTVATAIGLATLAAVTSLLVAIVAARARATEVAESVTALAATIDQIVRDVRLAGYDPMGAGFAGIPALAAGSVVLRADLDGSGTVDTASEEQIGYRVSANGDTLQRVVGQQSLPLLSDLAPGGFHLRYVDAGGVDLDPSAPGAADSVHLVAVELALRATAAHGVLRIQGGARLLNR